MNRKETNLWPVPEDLRCQGRSKRTGKRCKLWREAGSKYCRFHGGRSTGPRTPEGRKRAAKANYKHGRYNLASARKRLLKTVLRANRAAGAKVDKATLLAVWQMFQGLNYQQIRNRQKKLVAYLRQFSKDPQRDHRRRAVKLFNVAYETRNDKQPPSSVVQAFFEKIRYLSADELQKLKTDLQKDYLRHLAASKRKL